MSTTLYMAVSKGLNYNQHHLALTQAVLRERLSLLAAHPYLRSGSGYHCVNKRHVLTEGEVVMNSDFFMKRLWVQIPVSLFPSQSK